MTSSETPANPTPVDTPSAVARPSVDAPTLPVDAPSERVVEVGGRDGPEPTRFGDWERAGRCIDF